MKKVLCIAACSTLRCPVFRTDKTIKIALSDVLAFSLPIDTYVYMIIEAAGVQEEVRFDGGLIVDGELTVTRYRNPQEFPAGASVCVAITCKHLQDFVCQRVQECTDVQNIPSGDIRATDNTWTGVNHFTGSVSFGDAVFNTTLVDGEKLLQLNSGLWIDFSTGIDKPQYGYLASVKRTSGASSIYGAKFVARTDAGATGTVIGSTSEAWTSVGALAPLYGAVSAVYSQDSNSPSEKIGHMAYFRNRADNVSSVSGGIGANKYNQKSSAYYVIAQQRSSAGEFCGWNRGLAFGPGSLDETGVKKAIGIDFADIPDAEVARIKALVQLRANLGVEWNGASADSLNSSYNSTTSMWGFTWKGQSRFGFRVDNGTLIFADTNAVAPLLVAAAGAASGKYLPIEVNGTPYKIQLLT